MNPNESASGTAATTSFADLGVPAPLVRALQGAGIAAPFPIQADTLPETLAGRDVLGRGRTGSGKTLAFAIPVVSRLAGDLAGTTRPHRPAGLILAPTRELATQIATALEPLAGAYPLTVTTVFGGVSQTRQVKALKAGADIVVACPGRLEDLMRQGLVDLGSVGVTVIDEADHMADLGFLPGVTRILAATPARGQRLLFSATLDNGVDKLVKRFLPDAVLHSVDEAHSPVAAMTHHVFEVASPAVKKDVIRTLASGSGRRILFMRTKHQARKLAKTLTADGIPAVDLHGNLAQNARDRNLAAFAQGTARVLVATDVAARGVHVDGVELVVHVDPPAEHKAYLHRSGRTARAGSTGDVVTLVLPDQRKDTAALLRKAAITVRPQSVTADSRAVGDLVGVIAPVVAPTPAAGKSAGTGTRTGRSGSRPGTAARGGAVRSGNAAADGDRAGRRRNAKEHALQENTSSGRGRRASGAGPRGVEAQATGVRLGRDVPAKSVARQGDSVDGRTAGQRRRASRGDVVARKGERRWEGSNGGRTRPQEGRTPQHEDGRGPGDRPRRTVKSDARGSYSNGGRSAGAARGGKPSGGTVRGERNESAKASARQSYSTFSDEGGASRGAAVRNGREASDSRHAHSGGAARSGTGAGAARGRRQVTRAAGRPAFGGFAPHGGGRRG